MNSANKKFLKNVFTQLPHNLDKKLTAKYAGVGGVLAAALSALHQLSKKKEERNWWQPLWWGLAGASVGTGAGLVHQNALENLSAKYAQKIDDVYTQVFPRIDQQHPNKTYTIYFHGMNQGQTTLKDRPVIDNPTDSAVIIPGYYAKYLDSWMQRLPKDAKVNVIGHSYGGGTLHNALKTVTRPINNAVLVDPINSMFQRFSAVTPNANIKNMKATGALDLNDLNSVGNKKIAWTLGWLTMQTAKNYPEQNRLLRGHDHSMLNSRFRETSTNTIDKMVDAMHGVDKYPDAANSYFF